MSTTRTSSLSLTTPLSHSALPADSHNADEWSLSAQSDLTAVESNYAPSTEERDAFSDVLAPDSDASHCKRASSIYYSLKSRFSMTSSLLTDSTGRHSAYGATWRQSMTVTASSGFGSGAPRSDKFRGVREGREKGGCLPKIKGVGRIGRGPIPVPRSLVRAMATVSGNLLGNDIEEDKETETVVQHPELTRYYQRLEFEKLQKRVVRMQIQLSHIEEGMSGSIFDERYNELVLSVGSLKRDLEVDDILFVQQTSPFCHTGMLERHERQLSELSKSTYRVGRELCELDKDVHGPQKTFEAMRSFRLSVDSERRP